jgi:hypothetical protein
MNFIFNFRAFLIFLIWELIHIRHVVVLILQSLCQLLSDV